MKINADFEESKKIVQMSEYERAVYFAEKEIELQKKKNEEKEKDEKEYLNKKKEAVEAYNKAIDAQEEIYGKLQRL